MKPNLTQALNKSKKSSPFTEHTYVTKQRLSDYKQCKRWREVNEKRALNRKPLYTNGRKKAVWSGAATGKHRSMSALLSALLDTRRHAPKLLTNCRGFLSCSRPSSTLPRMYKHLSIMHFLSSPYIKNYQARQKQTLLLDCSVQWTLKKSFHCANSVSIFMRCNFVIDKCARLTFLC